MQGTGSPPAPRVPTAAGVADAAAGAKPSLPPISLRRALRWGFAGLVVVNVGTSLWNSWKQWKEFITLPPAFFLELDLEQQRLVERSSSNPLVMLRAAGHEVELHHLIQVLQGAKTDERVRGLLAVLGGRDNFGGLGQLQELRNALLDFRFHAQGRAPVYAYTNAFGEGGSQSTGVYYLSTAADKVFMPPSGMLSLLGFGTTQVFVKGLLDKLKVQPEVFRREEYKAALAPLTGTGFDPAHKQNVTELLGSMHDQVVEGIASARRLSPAAVTAAINAAPLLPSQAIQMKLLDGLLYRDQVERLLVEQLPAAVQRAQQQPITPKRGVPLAASFRSAQLAGPRVTLQRYSLATEWAKNVQTFMGGGGSSSSGMASPSQHAGEPHHQQQQQQHPEQPGQGVPAVAPGASSPGQGVGGDAAGSPHQPRPALFGSFGAGTSSPPLSLQPQDRPIVAVVTAAGPIMQSAAGGADPTGEGVVDSHRLVRALRSYRDNPQVKAVVLRINSPGGSAVASDMIAREVTLLRAAGKPVVACMGDVAASGGYYIAAPCNRILAQPGTITGSIGVIAMKVNVGEALGQHGITADSVALGDNADWSSPFRELSPRQRQQIDGMVGSTYDDFLAVVAEGRGLSREAVRQVAKGRVWSGSQALKIGLVDEVGGMSRAQEVAKQLAGLPMDPEATQTVQWPPRIVPPIVKLLQSAGGMPGSNPAETRAASATAAAAVAAAVAAAAGAVFGSVGGSSVQGSSAAAGLELLSMFLSHAVWGWDQQEATRAQLLPGAAPGMQQQVQMAGAASGAAGVQQQVLALLAYISQQRQQPEMYCQEAELLARSC